MEDREQTALFLPSLAHHPTPALTPICQSKSALESLECDHTQMNVWVQLWKAAPYFPDQSHEKVSVNHVIACLSVVSDFLWFVMNL